MDNHIYWTNFFKFLEDNLLPETRLITTINFSPDGKYNFSFETDGYESMIDQISLLESLEEVLSLEYEAASQENTGETDRIESSNLVTYDISIVLDSKIFKKN